jgi:hypothetical protein
MIVKFVGVFLTNSIALISDAGQVCALDKIVPQPACLSGEGDASSSCSASVLAHPLYSFGGRNPGTTFFFQLLNPGLR